jgi:predicted dehydrogenase
MAKFKVALIGLGRIASTIDDEIAGSSIPMPMSHMGSYLDVSEVEVVGGADTYAEQREAFGRRYGFDRLYADYREMLEKERPDIVSVCTSAKPRAEIVQTIASMDAGVKAIYAEKPIAISLEEADAMVDVCHEAGIVLAVNCSRRWDPWYKMSRKLIDDGEIGEVMQVNVNQVGNLSHNSHMLNLARYLAGGDGRVSWVFGDLESDEKAHSDDDLGGTSYLAFENGVRALVRQEAWSYNESDVMGSEGRIRAINDGQEFELWKFAEGGRRGQPVRHLFPKPQRIEAPNVLAIRDMMSCIENGGEPLSSGEEGRHDLEVAIALRESHRRGGVRVDLPITDRSQKIISYEVMRWPDGTPRAVQKRRDEAAG